MYEGLERFLLRLMYGIVAIVAVAIAIVSIPGGRDRAQATLQSVLGKLGVGVGDLNDAEQALDGGDPAQALEITAQFIKRHSSDPVVDGKAGDLAVRAGDEAAAERYYRLGESADAHSAWNYVSLGELYSRQGKYPEADIQLRSALAIIPNAQFLHYDLGVVELKEHLTAAALGDFKAELKLTPGYRPALGGEAQALAALGRSADLKAVIAQIALATPKRSLRPSSSPGVSTSSTRGTPKPGTSPNPGASPNSGTSPSPQPSPSATLAPSPSPLPIAQVVTPPPTSPPTPPSTPTPTRRRHAPIHKRPKTSVTSPPVAVAVATPRSISDIAGDAKSYLIGVASDVGFTRAIPDTDPTVSTATLLNDIDRAKASGGAPVAINAGLSALMSGRLSIAASAFSVAASLAPRDWYAPYLGGLTAQARGDTAGALTLFSQAVSRGGTPEAYVSRAIAELSEGDAASAFADAKHASAVAPNYEPARFTAGMLALVEADAPTADRELAAALSIGGAPARTSYFLSMLRQRTGG